MMLKSKTIVCFFGLFSLLLACKPLPVLDEEPGTIPGTQETKPAVVIVWVSGIMSSSAQISAMLESLGSSTVIQHGFCYAEHQDPVLSDGCIDLGSASATGSFSATIDGLRSSTKYYCRAFVRNARETVYSDTKSFTTADTPADVIAKRTLVYYTFDDETAESKAGKDYDGVFYGTPNFIAETASGSGKAVFLNGLKGQCVNIPYNLFKGYSAYSISVWLKDFSTGNIISGINSSGYQSCFYPRLYYTSDGKFQFQVNDYTGWNSSRWIFSYPCSSLQSGAWHHFAVTCNKNSQRLYVDGIQCDSKTDDWVDIGDSITKVQIGGNGDGEFAVSFSGKVDNVGIYTTELSADVIKYIFDNKL